MAFRDSPEYQFGLEGARFIKARFEAAGFHLFEVDDAQKGAPMYDGATYRVVAPDYFVLEGFKLECKSKGRATWFRNGGYYDHGWSARQHRHYQDNQRGDGLPVVMAIYEDHGPTEGPGLSAAWPLALCQLLSKLGMPRVSQVSPSLEQDPYVFFPRTYFMAIDAFIEGLERKPLLQGPIERRLL